MKKIICLLISTFSLNLFAVSSPIYLENKYSYRPIEGFVQKAITMQVFKKVEKFCALYIENDLGKQIIIIEDITDCFYTRSYRHQIGKLISIESPLIELDPILDEDMIQNFPHEENSFFYFSDPE